MEVHELAKQLFQNTEVRIFGTPDEPLFVANDIAEMLDIKNPREVLRKFEDYKKGVRIMDTPGGRQEATVLTEAGLYALILKSRKPIARDFEKWLMTEVLPSIRKTGKYNLQDTIEKQRLEELEKTCEASAVEIAELRNENIKLTEGYKPNIVYHEQDINDYTDEPCIYLMSLTDIEFKFGRTGAIDVRNGAHVAYFRKLGIVLKVVKIWKCSTMKIMCDTEEKIKRLCRQHGILVKKYDQTEIIATDNIEYVVEKINQYVHKQNSLVESVIGLKEVKLEIERIHAVNVGKKLDNERLEMEIHIMEMQSRQPNIPAQPADVNQAPAVINNTIVPRTLEQDITDWVIANPPLHREQSSIYFDRWKATTPHRIAPGKFNKLVIAQGYMNVKQRGFQIWVQAN